VWVSAVQKVFDPLGFHFLLDGDSAITSVLRVAQGIDVAGIDRF